MKRVQLVIFLFLFVRSCYSQITFQKTYGSANWDWANDVLASDSGYFILGATKMLVGANAYTYLIKTDMDGNILWTKIYSSGPGSGGFIFEKTFDGNYIICGARHNITNGQYSELIKIKDNGDTLFTKNYGAGDIDVTYDAKQTADSGFVIFGYIININVISNPIFVLKTDKTGNIEWSKSYGESQVSKGYSIIQTLDGGYAFTGVYATSQSSNSNNEILLVKIDSVGDTLWTKSFGGTWNDAGNDVIQTSDSGFIITGEYYSSGTTYDLCLIKTDANGDTIWTRTYGGTDYDEGYSIKQLSDGSYIVLGHTQSFGSGDLDCYLLKIDASGNLIWSRKYGGAYTDFSYSVKITNDGGYIIAGGGYNILGPSSYDVYLIKTDSYGFSGCNETNPPTITSYPAFEVKSAPLIVSNLIFREYNSGLSIHSGGTAINLCGTNNILSPIDNLQSTIFISPNPFIDNIKLNSESNVTIDLYDATGKEILRQNIYTGETIINTNKLTPGIYLLHCTDGRGYANFKVMKN